MPITVLIEFIRDMFQRWFYERYEEAVKVTMPLSHWVARQLSKRFSDAHHFLVKPINRVEFEVKDGKMNGLVNWSRNTRSCCEFQTDLLPCSHAIAAISKYNREAIEFCTDYYKTTVFVEGYLGSIRPVRHLNEWDIPPHVKQIVVLPPLWRGQAGRPRRKRIPSAGEDLFARSFYKALLVTNFVAKHFRQISMSRPLSDQDRVKVHSYIVCKNVFDYNLHQTGAMYLLICLKCLATKSVTKRAS
ncbi:PREDICTED: uncharacterized protein LOC108661901 [Theobroma cacao]|uniref:Uncharacterized protein LOC108661901 n=1 Tax=Theobroma cacao TaxID=3641 RepID=A0AB32WC45_THECC|nr:PREDICTED: uncharacterized protein LOC108661901 [Theobroma cacao]